MKSPQPEPLFPLSPLSTSNTDQTYKTWQEWCCPPETLAPQRLTQEDAELNPGLGDAARPCLKKGQKAGQKMEQKTGAGRISPWGSSPQEYQLLASSAMYATASHLLGRWSCFPHEPLSGLRYLPHYNLLHMCVSGVYTCV